ncbi:hypothetical protein N7G274_006328 [Stereocaulon virgatum]|uniref:AB hydrolase-1 domain-containing protein n=1 Tax=Stereocaulon virgatum TaxID=373712 RepID=A0ABR4A5Z4_9LECA
MDTLIHGFPETPYRIRHVINPLAVAGYHVHRGRGYSSMPLSGYTKAVLSQDLHVMVNEHVRIKDKIHLVRQDIGGMIAQAYGAQPPKHVASINWDEWPLPGKTA